MATATLEIRCVLCSAPTEVVPLGHYFPRGRWSPESMPKVRYKAPCDCYTDPAMPEEEYDAAMREAAEAVVREAALHDRGNR